MRDITRTKALPASSSPGALLSPIGEYRATPFVSPRQHEGRTFARDSCLLAQPLHDPGIMKPRTIWVIIGIAVVIALLFAGFLPLPGQKDNSTPFTEPAPQGKAATPGGR
jgi:hypothetical protein